MWSKDPDQGERSEFFDSFPERIFLKKWISNKLADDNKNMKNYPAYKEYNHRYVFTRSQFVRFWYLSCMKGKGTDESVPLCSLTKNIIFI